METLIKKKSIKKPIIIISSVVAAIVIIALSVFLIQKGNLDRAIKALDVENEQTVIRVMKYGGKKTDVVLDVAQRYLDAGMNTDASRLCVYALEYLEAGDAGIRMLESAGATDAYTDQFRSGNIQLSDFEVTTVEGSDGYGISDGIYTSFLGGYATAKLSAIVPIEIYAHKDGAYFLDANDSLIKSISRDGQSIGIIRQEKASEFVYYNSRIYYIDENGIPYGSEAIALSEGEFAMGIFIDGETVKCTVYNTDYEPVRELEIK
ncbi:MAG: hypothetical protein IJ408_02840 [Clostridia bacterium]|nr:hypothetical protein [Clostridia bacterium]